MRGRLVRRVFTGIVAFASALAVSTPLLAINVQPVVIDLNSTGRRASSVVLLENTFSEPVPVEVTVHPVRVIDGQLTEIADEEAEDVLTFPSQAVVASGASQAFRVQWVGDPRPAASQHYYVTIAQLPVALAPDKNAIQVLHRFRILVSVNAPDAKAALSVVKAEILPADNGKPRPVATVANTGDGYDYVGEHRMTIIQRDAEGKELFRKTFLPEEIQEAMGLGIVPSGQSRLLPIGVDLPSDQGSLSIEIATDAKR